MTVNNIGVLLIEYDDAGLLCALSLGGFDVTVQGSEQFNSIGVD